MDISIQSSNILAKVPGVGFDNSLRLTMNSTYRGLKVKYRIYISEVGTTQSKVKNFIFLAVVTFSTKVFFDVDPDYLGTQLFHLHGIHYVQVKVKTKFTSPPQLIFSTGI